MIDWLAIAARYEYPPDVFPTRPWWRFSTAQGWVRRDGPLLQTLRDGTLTPRVTSPLWRALLLERGAVHLDPPPTLEVFGTLDEVLAEVDRRHPMPAPAPAVGQVWAWPSDGALAAEMLLAVYMSMSEEPAHVRWPRGDLEAWSGPCKHWVLIAGPGAPWAPSEDPR